MAGRLILASSPLAIVVRTVEDYHINHFFLFQEISYWAIVCKQVVFRKLIEFSAEEVESIE